MFFDAVTKYPFPKPPPAIRGKATQEQRDAITAERHALALEMRKHGYSYEQIGEHFETSPDSARALVKLAMEKAIKEPGEEVITLELQRLDQLYRLAFNSACAGDSDAIPKCLKVMERRSKLLGIDAPEKKEVTGKNGGPIQLTNFNAKALSQLSEEELGQMEALLAKMVADPGG